MSYTFEKDNLAELNGTSKIINIGDRFSLEEATKIQGQLLTLFGEPGFISQNLEAAYGYGIIAKDSSGKTAVLHVYEGPSGPAIGGNRHQPGITEIAKALQDYIKQAEPADFEYEGYYYDGPSKIRRAIRQGKISCSEIEIKEEELP